MRFQELTIYSQYFRFLLEDDRAIAENAASPFGPVISSVIYDNERQTVTCSCSNDMPCEHKVFVHEMIDKERDDTLFRFLEDFREKSAQTITRGTINRLRGAFAREYNLAKGVVQYPERRQPLTMVEKAEPIYSTGKAEGRWITVPPGFNGTYTIGMTGLDALAKTARDQMDKAAREAARKAWESAIWGDVSATTASEYTVGIDPAKFKEDINKAKELLEKKAKPKPEKPAKPRTRFTDLEL